MKNERFKQVCHFVAGLFLLPLAFKLFEQKKFSLSVAILIAAIIFLSVAGSVELLEKELGKATKLFYLLECILLLFAATIHFHNGKKMPALAYACVGILYFLLFLYFLYDKDISKKKRKKHKRRSTSTSGSSMDDE